MLEKIKEVRFNAQAVEMREDAEKSELILEGYAVVFDEETFIGESPWGWYESISKTAFDDADMKDVPLRYNHSEGFSILARTRNKSLSLSVDDYGLKISARLQKNVTVHNDIYNMVQSGLIDKMSFAFSVADDEVTARNGSEYRYITKIGKLYDVSIVDVPAYDQTEVFARSRELMEIRHATPDGGDSGDLDKSKELELLRAKIHLFCEV